jgi:hypothetical protein
MDFDDTPQEAAFAPKPAPGSPPMRPGIWKPN